MYRKLYEDSEFKSVMWGVNCLKQDLQDLSDLQEWTSLLPETPVIELPNYLFKLHKVCATIYVFDPQNRTYRTWEVRLRRSLLQINRNVGLQSEQNRHGAPEGCHDELA